jgi:hypothetical protein
MSCIPLYCELCSAKGQCVAEAGQSLGMQLGQMAKKWKESRFGKQTPKLLPTAMTVEDKAQAFLWNLDRGNPVFCNLMKKVQSGECNQFKIDENLLKSMKAISTDRPKTKEQKKEKKPLPMLSQTHWILAQAMKVSRNAQPRHFT